MVGTPNTAQLDGGLGTHLSTISCGGEDTLTQRHIGVTQDSVPLFYDHYESLLSVCPPELTFFCQTSFKPGLGWPHS